MEGYQIVGVAVLVGMVVVVQTTIQLNRLRRRLGVERTMVNLRDWAVLRRPTEFTADEVSLVRACWASCASLLALMLLLFALAPDDWRSRLELKSAEAVDEGLVKASLPRSAGPHRQL